MASKVYFLKKSDDLIRKLPALFEAAAGDVIFSGDSVAVKMHFGEPGNNAYLKPHFVKPVIDAIRNMKAIPYLTDANTMYRGGRMDSKTHLESARKHGYSKENMGAEIVIADGPDSRDVEKIAVNLKHFKDVSIAAAGVRCDALIALSHFKGHDCTGFGGAIKNVGMGLGSRAGKAWMHAGDSLQEKMAEYTYGVLLNKKGKAAFLNFLLEISPNCDCYPRNGKPIVADIGVLASKDIVAIDQASLDMVNKKGKDKFRELYPEIDDTVQLAYAEKIGLGSREYELTEV